MPTRPTTDPAPLAPAHPFADILEPLGLTEATATALLVAPAAYVAGADDELTDNEDATLKALAQGHPQVSEAAWRIVRQRWLSEPMSDATMEACVSALLRLAYDDRHSLELTTARHAIDQATAVVHSQEGQLDPFHRPDAEERTAMGRLREAAARAHDAWGPDGGVVGWEPTSRWQQVLDDLDDTRSSTSC